MGILMKNGRLYSGGGSSSGDAKDIKYDNSNTELESTNIQDAIDEIYENGTGSSAEVELTQAEYDALSEEEKMNGTTYYISDAPDEQKVVELTQAEYDALSEEQKMADVNYFITDASNNSYLDIANSLAEVEANESEDKIAGALAVKELKGLLDNFIITENVAASVTRKVKLIGGTKGFITVLVTSIGNSGNAYGAWLVQGYGSTTSRIHVATIQSGNGCSFTISDTEAAVIFTNTTQSTFSYFVLSGDIEVS